MQRVIIELEGVAVDAVLNEQKCPRICEAFLAALPHTDRTINESFSGNAFRTLNPFPVPREVWESILHPRPGIEDRSFKTNMNPGDVVFYPGGGVNELCISYGVAQFRDGPAGATYVNHVATIDRDDPNFDAFMRKAAEIHYKGTKEITFRRKEQG